MPNNDDEKDATMNDVLATLQTMQVKLEELVIWQRINGAEKVRGLLHAQLDSKEKKVIYQLSDGKMARDEISAAAKVSTGAISGYWSTWYRLGLVSIQKIKGKDRYVRNFDPTDFGIEVPKLPGEQVQGKPQMSPAQPTLNAVIEQGSQQTDGGISQ